MRTPRFLWPAEASPNAAGEIFLAPDQARHAALVLRLETGDAAEALSPLGLAPARVNTVTRGKKPRLGLVLTGPWQGAASPGPTLAMALIKAPRFDWVVEKSVELGAAALIPVITERVKSGDARPGEARFTRWRRLAGEAQKQCGRGAPMEIKPPMTLARALLEAMPENRGGAFFLCPAAGPLLSPSPGLHAPLILIGPEGGFSPAEEAAMLGAGARPKSLGPTTLRSETAALAALARLLPVRADAY